MSLDLNMIIDGKECEAISQRRIEVFNPANEELVGTVPDGAELDAAKAVESSHKAFLTWRKRPANERASILRNLARKLGEKRDTLAKLLCTEHGKIYREGLEEIDGAVGYLLQSANAILGIAGDILSSNNRREQIWIHKVPYGVSIGLVAWNFPVALVARKLGPAIAAGNTMVVHTPKDVPLSVIELAKLALEAGLPAGVFNVVSGRPELICPALIKHPLTRLVTHTGSTAAGQKIIVNSASNVTDLILELGGKAPYIVLDDADIDSAVEAALVTRFYNGGQVCTCNERSFLHEAIYDEFLEKFTAKVKKLRVGNQFADVDLGPRVLKRDVSRIEALIDQAVSMGAKLAYQQRCPKEPEFKTGNWSFPTLITNVNLDMPIMREEIFGPVVPIMKISSFEEAIKFANDCEYGLAAYLWTNDFQKIMHTIENLDFGEIYVNRGIGEQPQGYHTGLKKSGLAGEDGRYGLNNYLHKKTYYVNFASTEEV